MTTLLTPLVTTRPPRVPPPDLLRAAWYRQRIAILSMLAFYGLVAGFALYQYFSLHSAFDTRHLSPCLTGPTTTFSPTCQATSFSVVSTFEVDDIVIGVAIVPAVAVIFGGVRWLSREYETGVFRYTWAQASSPARWFTVSGLPLLTATIAGAGLTWAAYHQWHAITWMQLDSDNAYSEYGFPSRLADSSRWRSPRSGWEYWPRPRSGARSRRWPLLSPSMWACLPRWSSSSGPGCCPCTR